MVQGPSTSLRGKHAIIPDDFRSRALRSGANAVSDFLPKLWVGMERFLSASQGKVFLKILAKQKMNALI
jgi:hypothetical protein